MTDQLIAPVIPPTRCAPAWRSPPLSCRHRLPWLHPRPAHRHLQTPAAEAGLTLTPDAARKAVAVFADAENGHATGNARLAVQLLTQATINQPAA